MPCLYCTEKHGAISDHTLVRSSRMFEITCTATGQKMADKRSQHNTRSLDRLPINRSRFYVSGRYCFMLGNGLIKRFAGFHLRGSGEWLCGVPFKGFRRVASCARASARACLLGVPPKTHRRRFAPPLRRLRRLLRTPSGR